MPIKALLLDQNRVFCGVGNWIADEACYKAGLHPASPSNTLSDRQIDAIYQAVIDVCTTAVGVDAESREFPEDWLFK